MLLVLINKKLGLCISWKKQSSVYSLALSFKTLRQENRMTQPELADKLGNNFQNISAIERGELTIERS